MLNTFPFPFALFTQYLRLPCWGRVYSIELIKYKETPVAFIALTCPHHRSLIITYYIRATASQAG
jgi:hypothetical protein